MLREKKTADTWRADELRVELIADNRKKKPRSVRPERPRKKGREREKRSLSDSRDLRAVNLPRKTPGVLARAQVAAHLLRATATM